MSNALLAFNPEAESLEIESLEQNELSSESEKSVLDETEQIEMASNLMGFGPGTLERMVEHLIRGFAKRYDKPVATTAVRELGRMLARFARTVLPSQPGASDVSLRYAAARMFGLELEGLSHEDQEFEIARAFVRLVEAAARRLAHMPQGVAAEVAARRAFSETARRHAPGLPMMSSSPTGGPRRVDQRGNAPIPKESIMHDIDRTSLEFGQQESSFEGEQFGEFGSSGEYGQGEWSGEGETEALGEAEQVELAAELLSVSNEAELEQFLGDLVKKVGQYAGQAIRSPVGQALIPVLKSAAGKALPMAGGAIGGYFGGPLGAQIGTGIANAAGQALGLEAEALSNEDREFEGAKQFVKLAAETVKNAAAASPNASPMSVAQAAAVAAAKALAPALLPGQGSGARNGQGGIQAGAGRGMNGQAGTGAPSGHGHRHSGRWVRKGKVIVLLGV